jgi:RNA polymerase sigma-70 factor (ECF subfamily)
MNNSTEKNKAIEQIWSDFSQRLADHICHKTHHQDYCHDILQDVYIKMVRNIEKIEEADNILPYILALANNCIIDYHRASPDKVTPVDLAPDLIPGAMSSQHSMNAAEATQAPSQPRDTATTRLAQTFLLELIESLPPIYRQALVRTELEGVSQKQLAEELGISYSGAKSRVQRAKEMLRESILGCCNYKFDKYGNVISCCGSDS